MESTHDPDDDAETAWRRFGPAEMAVYRRLLQGSASQPDCRAATGLDEDTVAGVLRELSAAKLVQPVSTDPPKWLAVSPNWPFFDFLSRLRDEYTELRQRVGSMHALLGELQSSLRVEPVDYRAMADIDKLSDSVAVAATLPELLADSQHSVRAMHPIIDAENMAGADLSTDRVLSERGIEIRSIYPHGARRQREVLHYLRQLQDIGVRFRTAASVPSRFVVVDDRVVVLMPRSRRDGGVIVREPDVVKFFERFFEDSWSRSLEVAEFDYGKDGCREVELLVLAELGMGRSDEAIARRLDVSTRTLRRYITGLYERFGVETRFQLGVVAARAGLLSEAVRRPQSPPASEWSHPGPRGEDA